MHNSNLLSGITGFFTGTSRSIRGSMDAAVDADGMARVHKFQRESLLSLVIVQMLGLHIRPHVVQSSCPE